MYKYRNLLKPLRFGAPEKGLFPDPSAACFMNSSDMEGYQGCVGIGYIKQESLFHPEKDDRMVVHPYNELLVFVGTNPEDLLELGAEVTVCSGEGGTFNMTQSSVAMIPKGLPHGPIRVQGLKRPIVHILLTDGLQYEERAEEPLKSGPQDGCRSCIKTLKTSQAAYETVKKLGDVRIDERGVMDLRPIGPGEAYQMIQMHPEDLLGINISFSVEFCKTPGSWMTTKLGHVHPEPELLLAASLDADHFDDLGASLEFWFGSEREVYVIDRPTLITIPRPWIVHTPLITQKVDRPFLFMLVYPGSYMQAGFVETGFDVS